MPRYGSNREAHLRHEAAEADAARDRTRAATRAAMLALTRRMAPGDDPAELDLAEATEEDLAARERIRDCSIAEGEAAMEAGEAESALEEEGFERHQ